MSYINITLDWLYSFPLIHVEEKSISLSLFNPKSYDPMAMVYGMFAIVLIVLALTFLCYKYRKWVNYNRFLCEMKSLGLEPQAEGTFAWIVKKYHMKESVKVLHSKQVFDEMASGEIFNVLCSAGTKKAKEDFIDTIYTIRQQTFDNDRIYNR